MSQLKNYFPPFWKNAEYVVEKTIQFYEKGLLSRNIIKT